MSIFCRLQDVVDVRLVAISRHIGQVVSADILFSWDRGHGVKAILFGWLAQHFIVFSTVHNRFFRLLRQAVDQGLHQVWVDGRKRFLRVLSDLVVLNLKPGHRSKGYLCAELHTLLGIVALRDVEKPLATAMLEA